MNNDIYENIYDDYLMHHGVKGMKWGIRRRTSKFKRLGEHRTGVTRSHIKDINNARKYTEGSHRRYYDNNLYELSSKHQKAYKNQTGKIRRAVDFATGGKVYINRQLAAHPNMSIHDATVKGYKTLGKNVLKYSTITALSMGIGTGIGSAAGLKYGRSPERGLAIAKAGMLGGLAAGAAINKHMDRKQTIKEFR